MSEGILWINGQLSDFSHAVVPVDDRGFCLGDGIYEVIRSYDGRPFALEDHLRRLCRSAHGVELALPMEQPALAALITDLIARSRLSDAEIYLQLTRGVARRNHLFPENTPPTLLVGVRPLRPMREELWQTGCRAVLLPDERWARCDLKTIGLLPNVLAKERARRAGALEAILVREGWVTEGSTSNVFALVEGRLMTPPADNRILNGVTRVQLIRLAEDQGIEVAETELSPGHLKSAEELILTSTTLELMPVVDLDGHTIGSGSPGPVYAALHRAFQGLTHRA